MSYDPTLDYEFTIERVELADEERIDPHEEDATLLVTVRLFVPDSSQWQLIECSLVVDVADTPRSVLVEGGDQGESRVRFHLDVGQLTHGGLTVVPVTVKTGVFAGANEAAPAGEYSLDAAIEGVYVLREPIRAESRLGAIPVVVAPD